MLYYSTGNNNYLFFFHISLSCYSEHKAKASCVHQALPWLVRAGRLPTMLEHYRSLIEDTPDVSIVYAYISPRELRCLAQLRMI